MIGDKFKTWLSRFVSSIHTPIKGPQYTEVFNDLFLDTEFSEYVVDEIVFYICTHNFLVNPIDLIEGFKSRGFSTDEYFVIMYKVGSLVNAYATNPALFLTHALTMVEDFKLKELELKELE